MIVDHEGCSPKKRSCGVKAEAAAVPFDMLELDVHETRDGKLAVQHDDTVAENGVAVATLDYSELLAKSPDSFQPPLLEECLAHWSGMPIDVEIKGLQEPDRVAVALERLSLPLGSLISSKYRRVLKSAKWEKLFPLSENFGSQEEFHS